MKQILLPLFLLISFSSKSQDSTDVELEKWLASRPYCDSIKAWYYNWSCVVPDGSSNARGEYFLCQWARPTKAEVLARVKKLFSYSSKSLKKFQYVKVNVIVETDLSHCPCQERKKAF